MEPITYNHGQIREDGYIYRGKVRRKSSSTDLGYVTKHVWMSPEVHHRDRISTVVMNCKRNAKKGGFPFDLSTDFLISIWPEDGCCPVFGIPMQWGAATGLNCSPSLDKIDPKGGYIRGNVAWISLKANRMKQDSTPEDLLKLLDYMLPPLPSS